MFSMNGIEKTFGFPLMGWQQNGQNLRGVLEGRSLVLVDKVLKDNPVVREMIDGMAGAIPPLVMHVPATEQIKDVSYAQALLASVRESMHPNPDSLAVFGGGTLINVANFIANNLDEDSGLRLPYHVIPTTLLAVSDVALGSKGNLNVEGTKHKLRGYRDPSAIVLNYKLLESLPPDEVRRGMAEAYKHALLQDTAYPSGCDSFCPSLGIIMLVLEQRRPDPHMAMLSAFNTIFAKNYVLGLDPRETTWMAGLLSYGHLHAHAYEMASGFTLNHGDSVPFGMLVDVKLGGKPRLYKLMLSQLSRMPLMDHLDLFAPPEDALKKAYHAETKPFFRPRPERPEDDAFYVLPLRHIGQYHTATPENSPNLLTVRFAEMQQAGQAVLRDLRAIKANPLRRIAYRMAASPLCTL